MTSPADSYAASRERQAHPELASFQSLYDFEFDDFQIRACSALSRGNGVLVAAPTGSGKTVVGEFAVHLALEQGRKCFYTTPIKALSNQKYNDLARRYGPESVGLLTGDNSLNGEAPVVVMTTEVLRNMLYTSSATLGGLSYVVLDEVHYLADRSRGAVWEEVIIHLPESVRVVALSATVSNAEEFGDWLSSVRGGTDVIVDEHRPVPLWQHVLAGNRLYDLFTDTVLTPDGSAEGQPRVNSELVRLALRDDWVAHKSRGRPGRGGQRPRRVPPVYRPGMVSRLDSAGLLPAIVFIFSRAGCDAAVQQCLAAGLRLCTSSEAEEIVATAERRTADIAADDLAVLGYGEWLEGLRRGIAAHHAGMLPVFKEVVEDLFTRGLIRVVFATETLALGINMPARTVVIEKLDKWNGETRAALTAGEYTQLTGRAGRRGIDVEGHAVVLWQPGLDPSALAGLAGTRTYPLNSSFRPSYNMAVNLTGWAGRDRAAALLESSFAQFQADRGVVGLTRQLRRNEQALASLASSMTCDRGDFAAYMKLRRELSSLEASSSRSRAAARRMEASAALSALRPGDIIRVTGGRRAGVAVVLGPGPLVLTEHQQVKRLSLADFPFAPEVLDHIRLPEGFSSRSPKHRRDLASAMRSKLAGRDAGRGARSGSSGSSGSSASSHRASLSSASSGSSGSSASSHDSSASSGSSLSSASSGSSLSSGSSGAEVEALRRELRRHPCHGCPDREAHARFGERYTRLARETEELERRVGSRSHVIARTFGRVCTVLERLGYLSGDTVTPDGRRLAGLYTELDLVAAECLRRGVWESLDTAELAACVSTLTFESRAPDDPAAPPRLPRGRVLEVLDVMHRTWERLDALEKENALSFLRPPDLGFAWAAYRWARGAALEKVLAEAPDLTPGDFVRAVKQLLDLLDQIAAAAGGGALSETARLAITALRRGVVDYSAVTD